MNDRRRELRNIKTQIRALRNDSGYSSVDYSQERVQTSPGGVSPAEKIVAKIMELEKQEEAALDAYLEMIERVKRVASALGGLKGEYVMLRYVEDRRPADIARELHYSVSYVYHIDMEANREIDRRGLCD